MGLLRRLLIVGIGAGLLAGLVSGLLQSVTTTPLILKAERFEQPETGATVADHGTHAHAAKPHGATAGDREARFIRTLIADLVIGAGFGLVLVAGFALRGDDPDLWRGLLWGGAGFLAFALAPALGLPPEPPGSAHAALYDRQLWWLLTAVVTAAGLWLAASGGWRMIVGLVLLPLPHLVGAPQPAAEAANAVPADLAAEFVVASLLTSLVFWIVLGGSAGWLHRRLG